MRGARRTRSVRRSPPAAAEAAGSDVRARQRRRWAFFSSLVRPLRGVGRMPADVPRLVPGLAVGVPGALGKWNASERQQLPAPAAPHWPVISYS